MPATHRPSRTRPHRPLLAVAAGALFSPLIAAVPATAAAAVELRDVREFACPPEQVPDAGFHDVNDNRLEINCLAAYGITSGVSSTRYDPAGAVSRAQMAVFVANTARYAGLTLDPSDAGFTDIAQLPARFRDAINGLANADIVNGKTATRFAPAESVSRGQMATFLTGLQATLQPAYPASAQDYFTDDNGTTHEPRINQLAAAGVVQGTSAGVYSPGASVSRQQMAAFVMRYIDDQIEDGRIRGKYQPRRVAEMDGDHEGLRNPDPDGTATTVVSLDAGADQVCYTVEFSNIEIRAVQVIRYGSGETVQKLYDEAPTNGPRVEGCKPGATEGVLAEMTEHPERFYLFATSYDGSEQIAGPMTKPTG
jgi:hypothetical protein